MARKSTDKAKEAEGWAPWLPLMIKETILTMAHNHTDPLRRREELLSWATRALATLRAYNTGNSAQTSNWVHTQVCQVVRCADRNEANGVLRRTMLNVYAQAPEMPLDWEGLRPDANRTETALPSAVVLKAEEVANGDLGLLDYLRVRAEATRKAVAEFLELGGRGYVATQAFWESILSLAVADIYDEDAARGVCQDLIGWIGPQNVPSDFMSWLKGEWAAANTAEPASEATALEAQAPAIPEVSDARLVQMEDAAQAVRAADIAVMDAFPVMEALGRIKAAHFTRHVADSMAAQAYIEIKNGKKYKGLPYRDANGEARHVADLEEFCRVFLGRSARRVQELAQNLHVLGPELYESAQAIGFKARDYAALKALPESEQAVVKEALAADSKDQVLDILQDLAARHASEKAAMKKEATDLKADLAARDKVLHAKAKRADELAIALEKLKSLPPAEAWRLRLAKEEEAVAALALDYTRAEAAANAFIARCADILSVEDVSQHTRDHVANTVRYFTETLGSFLSDHAIDVHFEDLVMPSWIKDQAATDLGGKPGEAE